MLIQMQDVVPSESVENDEMEEMATLEQFERCVDACGFGKYQWWMLTVSLLGVLAHVSVMLSTPFSFVIGDEYKYYKEVKVILFMIPYLGMIFSSIISGFLSDCFGRRKVIIVCYAGLLVATILEGAGRHYKLIVLAKYLEGFFLGGAFVASTTLQAEFQTEKSRDRIIFTLNFFVALSQVLIILPFLNIASLIWDILKIDDVIGLHRWDFYILFNSVFSLAACLLYAWLPDSPKSDFVHGRYKDALQTVKRIYSVNTGKSADEFPYQLLGMTNNEIKSRREQFRATWSKVKLILKRPLLKYLIIIAATQVTFSLGYNTMTLWHPTIRSVSSFDTWMYSNSSMYLCGAYEENHMDEEIDYMEEIINHMKKWTSIVLFSLIPYIVVTIFINVGKRLLIPITLSVCCCCIISMHLVNDDFVKIFLFVAFLGFGQLFIGLIQAVVVEIFPVWTKSLALSLTMTASAIGAVLAEVIFPSLLQYGCELVYIVAAIIACAALFSLFLLKT